MTRARIRVMIVDDHPAFRELTELLLSLDPQFEVVGTAGTGEEAIEHVEAACARAACPDIILLDFRLPGIDGLETAKRVKEKHPEIVIAMVTAHTEQVLARFAQEADIQEVIPKASFSLERVQRLLPQTA